VRTRHSASSHGLSDRPADGTVGYWAHWF
jgi:hypothetical protein